MAVQSKVVERRPQAERRAEAEEALLDAAAELFAEQGLWQTSLAQIGERAGYSRGLVNYHFGSKNALVDRLVQHCQVGFWDALAKIDIRSGLDGILAITETYLGLVESLESHSRAFLVVWGAAMPEASTSAPIAEADERSRKAIESWTKRGHLDGSISRDVKAETIGVTLLGLLRGVAAQVLVAPDAVDVGALRSQCRAAVLVAFSTTQRGKRARKR